MKIYLIMLAIVAFALPSSAAEEESILSKLMGEWRSNDAAFGLPAASTMTWSSVLNGKFVHLDYQIEMQNETDQTSLFQGTAYYKMESGDNFVAFWADNSGDLHPITAERGDSALVAYWGVEGGKQGRTRYQLISSDRMEVTDWIKTADGWNRFNFLVFTKNLIEGDQND